MNLDNNAEFNLHPAEVPDEIILKWTDDPDSAPTLATLAGTLGGPHLSEGWQGGAVGTAFALTTDPVPAPALAKAKGSKAASDGYKPLPIQGKFELNPAHVGGKAAGLNRLKKQGIDSPKTWVILCNATFNRPKINLEAVREYGGLWAVRSGAAESMPGAMQTKLNVPVEDIPAAIEAVWDSWNSAEAVAWRDAKGKPHDEGGTAVVLQPMIEAAYSGIAFSHDPTQPFEKGYSPIIQWVEGYGDKLVGGNVTGNQWLPHKSPEQPAHFGNWSYICTALLQMVEACGPSDIEWVIRKGDGTCFIVQHRAMKFAPQPAKPLSVVDGRKVFAVGRPIGAPVAGFGTKVKYVSKKTPTPYIMALNDFAPEHYPAMLKSAGIITSIGGELCHAAIMAREFNLPAITGIADYLVPEGDLWINGVTGEICEALPSDKGLTTPSKPKHVEKFVPARPNLGIQSGAWSSTRLALTFYDALEQNRIGKLSKESLDEIVLRVSEIVSSYYYYICVCEARHMWECGKGDITFKREMLKAFNERGIRISSQIRRARDSFAKTNIPQPDSLQRALEVLEICHKTYTKMPWNSSFGGSKWGAITNHALKYFQGKMSPLLWLDQSFNMEHNGGNAFGKFVWFKAIEKELLNARQESYAKMAYAARSMSLKSLTLEDLALPALGPEVDEPLLTKWSEDRDVPKGYCPQCEGSPLLLLKCGCCSECNKETCKHCAKCAKVICKCCKACNEPPSVCNCHDCEAFCCSKCQGCTKCKPQTCTCICAQHNHPLESCGCCLMCMFCFHQDKEGDQTNLGTFEGKPLAEVLLTYGVKVPEGFNYPHPRAGYTGGPGCPYCTKLLIDSWKWWKKYGAGKKVKSLKGTA